MRIEQMNETAENPRVLVVEDESIIAMNLRNLLSSKGYRVTGVACGGREALDMVEEHRPDIVLMDIVLRGEMDGIETAGLLKNYDDTAVVYMTAHSDDETLRRAMETEPHGYVVKPVSAVDLHSALQIALYKSRLDKKLRESEELHRVVLESISDAVFITDDKGRFTYVCPNAHAIFGRDRDEITAMGHVSRLLGDGLYSMEDLRREGELVNIERTVADSMGTAHTLLVNIKRVDIGGGTVLITCRDITEKQRLDDINTFQSDLLDRIGDYITATDMEGTISYVNEAVARAFGAPREDMIGASVMDFGEDPARGATQREIVETVRRAGLWSGDVVNILPDGREVIFNSRVWLIRGAGGEPAGMVGVSTDITDRRRMEEELKRANEELRRTVGELGQANEELQATVEELDRSNEELASSREVMNGIIARQEKVDGELRASIAEKTTLIREVHHRVKNNFQVISSLLNLQSQSFSDPGLKEAFRECKSRIMSMSLIHEKMYGSHNLAEIPFDEYLAGFINEFHVSYAENLKDVALTVDADRVMLDLDRAIPLGLIVNELLTNAVRYAFPPSFDGEKKITVNLYEKEGMTHLSVTDTGVGLPGGVTPGDTVTLGLTLVPLLVEQVRAVMTITRENGSAFHLFFRRESADDGEG